MAKDKNVDAELAAYRNTIESSLDEDNTTPEEKAKVLGIIDKAMPLLKVIVGKEYELDLSPEEKYVIRYLILNHDTKGADGKELNSYNYALLQITIMEYVHEHKTEVIEFNNPATRLAFVRALTDEDLREIKLDRNSDGVQQLLSSAEPSLDDILKVIGFGNAVHLYERRKKEVYRTRSKAIEAGAIEQMPTALALLTNPTYQNAISFYQNGGAYLQGLTSTDGLKFKGGKMYFEGNGNNAMKLVSEVELQNMKTKEGIESIDLMTLRIFYSIILRRFELSGYKQLDDVVTVYVPELAGYLGLPKNLSRQSIDAIISKAQSFHNIVGVMHGTRNGKPSDSLYQVLNFDEYDDKKNTITFNSPYMNYLIRTIYNISIRKAKDGKPKLKKNGTPLLKPAYSWLLKSEIAKERNKAAVENVAIIVTLIEQAGDNLPRIKASTIVERNTQLEKRLEEAKNPNALLKRTFTKTWELLRTKTKLAGVYQDIQLPDPEDPANIPTPKTLDSLVFTFPHNGKKKA